MRNIYRGLRPPRARRSMPCILQGVALMMFLELLEALLL